MPSPCRSWAGNGRRMMLKGSFLEDFDFLKCTIYIENCKVTKQKHTGLRDRLKITFAKMKGKRLINCKLDFLVKV